MYIYVGLYNKNSKPWVKIQDLEFCFLNNMLINCILTQHNI